LPLRLVFMGTPDFAVPTLLELIGAGHSVAAIYTRAPRPAGRGMELRPTPVAGEAERFGIPICTPKTLRTPDAAGAMRAYGADAAVVVAYGLILPTPILAAFPLGAFNLHGSLLPRWRGAAPIQRALMAGDRETGVMVMKMEEGLDTGPIAMAQRGAKLMVIALAALERGALQLTPQPETGITYANKIEKSETRIDWSLPWQRVHDHCRGLSPFPGAWCELPGAGRVKVLRTTKGTGEGKPGRVLDDKLTIACGTGSVRLVELQRAGGKPLSANEFLRGVPVLRASVLI
jgi:methionyl-tRNA formyltransferase